VSRWRRLPAATVSRRRHSRRIQRVTVAALIAVLAKPRRIVHHDLFGGTDARQLTTMLEQQPREPRPAGRRWRS